MSTTEIAILAVVGLAFGFCVLLALVAIIASFLRGRRKAQTPRPAGPAPSFVNAPAPAPAAAVAADPTLPDLKESLSRYRAQKDAQRQEAKLLGALDKLVEYAFSEDAPPKAGV